MRIRRLKPWEKEFVELNSQILEIQYYPRKAKKHRAGISVFKIKKGRFIKHD